MRKILVILMLIFSSCNSGPKYIIEKKETNIDNFIVASILEYNYRPEFTRATGVGNRKITTPGGFISFSIKLENISEKQITILWDQSTIIDENGVHKLFAFKKSNNSPSFYFQHLIIPEKSFLLCEITSLDNTDISVTGSGIGSQFGGLSVSSNRTNDTFKINGILSGNSFKTRICYIVDNDNKQKYYDFVINMKLNK